MTSENRNDRLSLEDLLISDHKKWFCSYALLPRVLIRPLRDPLLTLR